MRHVIGIYLGLDLKKDWVMNEEYLTRKTKDELMVIGKNLGVFKSPEVLTYIREKLKLKGTVDTLALKKGQLIDLFLKSGVSLEGRVPKEILL
jgi:hypothetical protein